MIRALDLLEVEVWMRNGTIVYESLYYRGNFLIRSDRYRKWISYRARCWGLIRRHKVRQEGTMTMQARL